MEGANHRIEKTSCTGPARQVRQKGRRRGSRPCAAPSRLRPRRAVTVQRHCDTGAYPGFSLSTSGQWIRYLGAYCVLKIANRLWVQHSYIRSDGQHVSWHRIKEPERDFLECICILRIPGYAHCKIPVPLVLDAEVRLPHDSHINQVATLGPWQVFTPRE